MNTLQVLNFKKNKDINTVNLAVTSTTSRIFFGGYESPDKTIMIWNSGNHEAFIDIGGTGVESNKNTSMPIPRGSTFILSAPNEEGEYLSAICDSGKETKLYITSGQGF